MSLQELLSVFSAALRYPRRSLARWLFGLLALGGLGLGMAPGAFAQSLIHTVAGSGCDGVAIDKALNETRGVAVDSAGNLFVAAAGAHQVCKVTPGGAISTVAGNGSAGFSGDGASATAAQLYYPVGVAVDSSGNLFIADQGNNRIRKVDTSGTISTVAGNGSPGYSGDGTGATTALIYSPSGVAVDSSGNLFIADFGNYRIRKVDTSGTISTVAGNGIAGYSGDGASATAAQIFLPVGVAVDSSGNLFIADQANQRIRKVDTSGIISTVAGNGSQGYSGDGSSATAAQINLPGGVAVDSSGNLFIADLINQRIRKVDTSGTISTVAGNGSEGYSGDGGSSTAAQLARPIGVAVDSNGNLFIADLINQRIRKVDMSGTISTVAGNGSTGFSGDGASATAAKLYTPWGVAVDGSGNLFIADNGNNRIRKVNPSGTISTVAGNGSQGYSGDGASATAAQLNLPIGVAVDSSGNLFIADRLNQRIRKVDTSGNISTVAGNGSFGYSGDGVSATEVQLSNPMSVALDNSGNLFIADQGNHRIRKVDTSGTIFTVAGNGSGGSSGDGASATAAQLFSPVGVAVDGSGNLFIADQGNHRIRKVDTSGTISTVAGNGSPGYSGDGASAIAAQIYSPSGVAVDSSGNLFIADFANQRIRKVDTSGTISTVAGNGNWGFSGDGASAMVALLNSPRSVAVDGSGNLFIGDQGNNRIRKVGPDLAPLAPSNVTAVAGDSQAQVSWSVPVGNGGSTVTGYTVTSSPAGASCPVTIISGSTQQSCTATGLTNGQSYAFSVVATNAAGDGPAATSNTVTPMAALMLALPANAVNAQLGEVYELPLVASGGAGGYTFALDPNTALPAGLSLNTSTGAITGTPTAAPGSYPVTVLVTDSASNMASLTMNIIVVLADVKVPAANQTLPDAVVGTAYNASIVATGGAGGYGFSVSAGQLPAGLTLNPDTGAITGTPTQVESQDFSITIVDSTLKSARLKAGGTTVHSTTQSFSIAVKAAPLVPSTAATPVPSLGAWAVALLSLAAGVLGALGLGWRRRSAKA